MFCATKGRTKLSIIFFFFNDTATTEIYTLSLHDALPICKAQFFRGMCLYDLDRYADAKWCFLLATCTTERSEEHTSELQSQSNLVCRLLLEKKTNLANSHHISCS